MEDNGFFLVLTTEKYGKVLLIHEKNGAGRVIIAKRTGPDNEVYSKLIRSQKDQTAALEDLAPDSAWLQKWDEEIAAVIADVNKSKQLLKK